MNNSWDEERRNYRGGQNRPIWIVDLKTYDLVTPPWTDSKDMDPVWVGDTVYFISDRDGVANVWSYETGAKKLAQVTKFTDFDVKTLDAGAGAVVFEQAGDIHELDPKTGREHVVNITAAGDFPWMMPRWEDVTSRMTNIALSPTGKRVVVEARGEIFTIPAEKGDVRNLTNSSASAERDPAWSPDGKYVSWFSDKSGEYKLVIAEQDGAQAAARDRARRSRPTTTRRPGRPIRRRSSSPTPTCRCGSSTSRAARRRWSATIRGWCRRRTVNPVWSPDSKWVAYASHLNSLYRAIFVSNVETGETKQVTDGLADALVPGVGRERQVPLVPRVHRLRARVAVARHDVVRPRRRTSASTSPCSRRASRARCCRRATRTRASARAGSRARPADPRQPKPAAPRGGRGGEPAARLETGRPTRAGREADRAPKKPVTVQIDFDGLQQADPLRAGRARAALLAPARPASTARSSTSRRRPARSAAG